jgi:hypothetical protein
MPLYDILCPSGASLGTAHRVNSMLGGSDHHPCTLEARQGKPCGPDTSNCDTNSDRVVLR